ncbi:hypothetical protein D3C85_1878570 [compost metagenome]
MAGQRITDRQLLQVALAGDQVELVQFQPQPLRHRAIQLAGADQWAAQAVGGALQGDGE